LVKQGLPNYPPKVKSTKTSLVSTKTTTNSSTSYFSTKPTPIVDTKDVELNKENELLLRKLYDAGSKRMHLAVLINSALVALSEEVNRVVQDEIETFK
jgi:hypothetical protein